jgi:O-antigen/teichoic acid export membrane protein
MMQRLLNQTLLSQSLATLKADKALQNSLYLIASTGIMAVSGFIFMVIASKLYTTHDYGLATTLIAAGTTLALFALLGFDNALVRYLPNSDKPNRVIDTSVIVNGIASAVLALVFIFTLELVSPDLHEVLPTIWHRVFFVAAMVVVSLNTLTDSIFISLRSAKYVLFANTGMSLGKIALPVVLAGSGAFGLFMSHVGSVAAATLLSLFYLVKRFNWRFQPVIDRGIIRQVRRFSAGTFVSHLVSTIPFMALPIIVINAMGGTEAGYFNLGMTMAAMLFIVPLSTANALYAEISKHRETLFKQTVRTAGQTFALLVPLTAAICLIAPPLLRAVGVEPQLVDGATLPLQILALSGAFVGVNAIVRTLLKITHSLRALFAIQLLGTLIIVISAMPLSQLWGASGAALAWLIGEGAMTLAGLAVVLPLLRRESKR